MKRLLCLLFISCLFSIHNTYGQYGLQPAIMFPSGSYYPYIIKPGVGAEFVFKVGDIDKRYKIGFFMGYYSFHTTQDTFKTYAIGGNPVQLLPGYEVIHNYSILQVGLTNDFKILPDGKFSPVLGLDIGMNVFDISQDDYSETFIQSSSQNDYYYNWVIIPRIGAQYQLNDNWLFMAGLGRSMGFGGMIGQQAFWKPYLGIIYYTK